MNQFPVTAPEATLPRALVGAILAGHDEACDMERIGYYDNVQIMCNTMRSQKNWTEGEVFVYAQGTRYVIAKQVAPASCEMMILTHNGFHDVVTACSFGAQELFAMMSDFLSGIKTRQVESKASVQ